MLIGGGCVETIIQCQAVYIIRDALRLSIQFYYAACLQSLGTDLKSFSFSHHIVPRFAHTHPTTSSSFTHLPPPRQTPPKHIMSRIAITSSGIKFPLPPLTDIFHVLIRPPGISERLILASLILTILSLALPLPPILYLFYFLFWRLSYNLFLGCILHHQSKSQFLTHWVSSLSPSAKTLFNHLSTSSLPTSYAWESSPDELNAWLVFRLLATVILANDGVSYVAFVLKYLIPFSQSSPALLLITMPAAALLMILSVWAKGKAHVTLGDFAWFWGDFFFTLHDCNLVFEGVFNLFPHPMYTAGYAGYYAAALFTRSYTVLFVSLLAHILQLTFLTFVEQPHIDKIYPKPQVSKIDDTPITDESSPSTAFIAGIPAMPVVAALTAVCATLTLVGASGHVSSGFVILLVIIWRLMHWGACAALLGKSSDKTEANMWMRLYGKKQSKPKAYSSWQHVYLTSYMINHALFVVAALTLESHAASSSWMKWWSHILGGLTAIGIGGMSAWSAWREIGWFGFYYGDFFVTPGNRELVNVGPYRYVSHPEVTIGYLVYYGVATMMQSWDLIWLTMFCQGVHWTFVTYMEQPNIECQYKLTWRNTELESFVMGLPGIGKVVELLRRVGLKGANIASEGCVTHFETVSKQFVVGKEKLQADLTKKSSKIWEEKVVRPAVNFRNKAEAQYGVMNCERVVTLLEKSGNKVRKLA